ncbi:SDR family oxidoreductase [Gordonia sp. X0973]|uniref:SDR family oxidoreductase n=1 Tax=Gordonia sp. X0973 TaxID=2742602 RepID=UPI000F54307E|nr:SDR family NAD(P)-dependent oxidoreductase [Gordonia sp. X0973]QKT08361.1 SDR family oxidoreductase [Gordonia sp. X0973]
MDIDGRVAIVTGGANGIGAALTSELVRRGARVVVADLDPGATEAAAASLPDGSAVAVAGDTSDPQVIAAQIAAAQDAFGPVDLYFANAGIGTGAGLDATDAEWTASIDVNLLAHVRAAQALVPGWVERGSGYFVATASAAGLLSQIGSATYSTTKHAAVGFAEWLSITFGDDGVGVSCVCPMGVDTALLRPERAVSDDEALMLATVESAGAVLTPEAVAAVVLDAVEQGRFLVLPHPEVLDMYRGKGADYDRWLAGMRRMQRGVRSALAADD